MKIVEILNRIKWDNRFRSDDFYIEYYDRVLNSNKTIPFSEVSEITPGFLITQEGSQIPIHRIRRILKRGLVFFDRNQAVNVGDRVSKYLLESNLSGVDVKRLLEFDWRYEIVKLVDITYDYDRMDRVDRYRVEFQKRMILSGMSEPLVVAYYNNFLIDGYARYKAYEELEEPEVPVYLGLPKEGKLIWNWKERREEEV